MTAIAIVSDSNKSSRQILVPCLGNINICVDIESDEENVALYYKKIPPEASGAQKHGTINLTNIHRTFAKHTYHQVRHDLQFVFQISFFSNFSLITLII